MTLKLERQSTSLFPFWANPDGGKQPFNFERADVDPMAFAGIWDGETVATITTAPNSEASIINDRMQVIVEPENLLHFLNPEPLNEDEQNTLLALSPDGLFKDCRCPYW